MTDKILRLFCRPECENCKGSGIEKRKQRGFGGIGTLIDPCPDCTDGYTDSVMEFELTPEDGYGSSRMWRYKDKYELWYDYEKAEWVLFAKTKYGDFSDRYAPESDQREGEVLAEQTEQFEELVPTVIETVWLIDSLNPTHLEVIELIECPECHGKLTVKIDSSLVYVECKTCKAGKIEVVTQFTVFGSKEEYDRDIVSKQLAQKHGVKSL